MASHYHTEGWQNRLTVFLSFFCPGWISFVYLSRKQKCECACVRETKRRENGRKSHSFHQRACLSISSGLNGGPDLLESYLENNYESNLRSPSQISHFLYRTSHRIFILMFPAFTSQTDWTVVWSFGGLRRTACVSSLCSVLFHFQEQLCHFSKFIHGQCICARAEPIPHIMAHMSVFIWKMTVTVWWGSFSGEKYLRELVKFKHLPAGRSCPHAFLLQTVGMCFLWCWTQAT